MCLSLSGLSRRVCWVISLILIFNCWQFAAAGECRCSAAIYRRYSSYRQPDEDRFVQNLRIGTATDDGSCRAESVTRTSSGSGDCQSLVADLVGLIPQGVRCVRLGRNDSPIYQYQSEGDDEGQTRAFLSPNATEYVNSRTGVAQSQYGQTFGFTRITCVAQGPAHAGTSSSGGVPAH